MNKTEKLTMLAFINSLTIGDYVVSYDKINKIETVYHITDANIHKQVYNRLRRDILIFNREVKAYYPEDEAITAIITVRKPNMLLTIWFGLH